MNIESPLGLENYSTGSPNGVGGLTFNSDFELSCFERFENFERFERFERFEELKCF